MFFEIRVLKNFAIFTGRKITGKHLRWSLFLIKLPDFRPTEVFSCDICKLFKNTFFYRTPPVAASEKKKSKLKLLGAR